MFKNWLIMTWWMVCCSGSLAFAQEQTDKRGGSASRRGADSESSQRAVRGFMKQYCYRCHGPEVQENDLRLDTLGSPERAGATVESWQAALLAIESGDMPPKQAPQPSAAQRRQAVRSLSQLLSASRGERPVALRRMNRIEYEHTLQDLLGIDTPLSELLPEDGSVQGFDNVADGLSISSILMERYLEAANAAFDGVIRRVKPLPPQTRRVVMMEVKENVDSVKQKKGGTIEVDGSFIKFTPGWPPARLDQVHPIEDGIYRCRIAVWPHDPSQRTIAVAVYVGPLFGPGKRRLMGVYDAVGTAEKPRIIEFTTFMREAHTMHIVPLVFPEHVTWRDKHEPRPGVGIVWAETHGPLDQAWPSPAQQRLFGADVKMVDGDPVYIRHRRGVRRQLVDSEAPREDVARIIRQFVPQAFRRPVEESVVDQYVALGLSRLDAGRSFEEAVRAGITAVLCSPQFLLLNREPDVDDYTLASRLSYFLWSSLPDEELLKLAADGRLQDSRVRHAQVERMLADPRSERFIENFTGQWLDLREIDFTTPDKKLYPEFDELLQYSMLNETRGFFRHLLEHNLSVMNFVDSDFAVLNQRLAEHYGIPGVRGHEEFRIVELPEDSVRGGVLAQASVLKVTANGTTTSPVLRGVWVLDRLLGQPAPPPPAGVPAVEPDIRGATTIREQLAKHRQIESCARCHNRIDPPGFALEEFDPIGTHRSRYRSLGEGEKVRHRAYRIGLPVESSGQTQNDEQFENFRAFRELLLQEREQVARAVMSKLLIYGTGRPVTVADRAVVERAVETCRESDFGLRSMVHAVVDSELFLSP